MPAETLETGEPRGEDGGADKPFFEKVKDIFG